MSIDTEYYDLLFVVLLYIGLNITARNVTLPAIDFTTFASLLCIVNSNESNFTLSVSTVESRWIVNETVLTPGQSDRYFVNEGDGPDGEFETILLIQRLIYSDAGNYTCEVRDTRDSNSPGPWISDQLTLQLLGTAFRTLIYFC